MKLRKAKYGQIVHELEDLSSNFKYAERFPDSFCRVIVRFFDFNSHDSAFKHPYATGITAVASVFKDDSLYLAYKLPEISSEAKANRDQAVVKNKINFVDSTINGIINGINLLIAAISSKKSEDFKSGIIFELFQEFSPKRKLIEQMVYNDILKLAHHFAAINKVINSKILKDHTSHPEVTIINALGDGGEEEPFIGKSIASCYSCEQQIKGNHYSSSSYSGILYRNQKGKQVVTAQNQDGYKPAKGLILERQLSSDMQEYNNREMFAPGLVKLQEKHDLLNQLFIPSNRIRKNALKAKEKLLQQQLEKLKGINIEDDIVNDSTEVNCGQYNHNNHGDILIL
ncbi:hypothetical protein [Candidatus Trichorickettsia mobilis]|uniref:hypothetical protein n=1 Tax=Candidatus Trichorickettsia mobilis TaxID=1346319 RepID=UPI002931D2C6|nr:hypothetical protein [Candidatus Trichorickettsia mobilis]